MDRQKANAVVGCFWSVALSLFLACDKRADSERDVGGPQLRSRDHRVWTRPRHDTSAMTLLILGIVLPFLSLEVLFMSILGLPDANSSKFIIDVQDVIIHLHTHISIYACTS